MKTITIYDPPSGWMYGFPREYDPSNPLEPIEYTLRRDGYPQKLIDQGMHKYCRFWSQKVKDEDNQTD